MSFDVCDGYFITASGQEAQGAPLQAPFPASFTSNAGDAESSRTRGRRRQRNFAAYLQARRLRTGQATLGIFSRVPPSPVSRLQTGKGCRGGSPSGGAGVR